RRDVRDGMRSIHELEVGELDVVLVVVTGVVGALEARVEEDALRSAEDGHGERDRLPVALVAAQVEDRSLPEDPLARAVLPVEQVELDVVEVAPRAIRVADALRPVLVAMEVDRSVP